MMSLFRAGHARLRVLVAVAAVAACALPATAHAAVSPLTIQTQNLYLGADLTPAVQATTLPQFFAAANSIWTTVKASNPPARMQKIADEIATAKPDVVALQEVAKWTALGGGEPSFDFLTLLQQALSARGLNYSVASTSENATFGPFPLPSPSSPTFLLTFHDRDVILVKSRPGLSFSGPQNATFTTQLSLPLPAPLPPATFTRGWASINGVLDGRSFHFVDTHLETEAVPPVQVAQANELLAGPLSGSGAVIAAGDFNSAADGSTTQTYSLLRQSFSDAWINGNQQSPGFTCCQAADLLNKLSLLRERIDLVLTKNVSATPAPKAKIVNDRQVDRTTAGQWASDHAGVVATVLP
jgi:endonuclease/exonuclease/phosphatase family metal-dependent hydrolase